MNTAEQIFEQVKALPEPMTREVLDFVGYLKEKQEQGCIKDLVEAQAGSMAEIWDGTADEAWPTASKLAENINEPLLNLEAKR